MKKIILYLGFSIEITFNSCTSQFSIYEGEKLILFQSGYPGFAYRDNGLLDEAQWSIERHIALNRLRKIKHKAFANI